jgi:hypothetical protein
MHSASWLAAATEYGREVKTSFRAIDKPYPSGLHAAVHQHLYFNPAILLLALL